MREVKRIFNGIERTYLEYTEEELEQMRKEEEEQLDMENDAVIEETEMGEVK